MNDREENDVRLADALEAVATADSFAAAPEALGFRVERIAGATAFVSKNVPATYFNRVIGLGDGPSPATDADLAALVAAYREAGVPRFWIHLTPTAEPTRLPDLLAARGFAPASRATWAKFLRGPEAPPATTTDLRIREATRADAPEVARIVCAAFQMPSTLFAWVEALVERPRWTFLVACDRDTPVAAGAVFIDGDRAWLGFGGTVPEARGKGAQGALLAARIRVAAEAGCSALATETGEPTAEQEHNPSLSNIRRYGFRQVCSRRNFGSPA